MIYKNTNKSNRLDFFVEKVIYVTEFILNLCLFQQNRSHMHDIFISYSRKDSEAVGRFVEKLTEEGYSVWIDKDGIESGDQFKLIIVKAIEESKIVLFFSSEASNASTWTAKEIGIANARSKPIIPIKLDGSNYNRQVEFDLINNDYVDFTDKASQDAAMKKLLKAISRKCSATKDCSEDLETPRQKRATARKKRTWWVYAVSAILIVVLAVLAYQKKTVSHIPGQDVSNYASEVSSNAVNEVDEVKQAEKNAEIQPPVTTPAAKPISPEDELKKGFAFFTGNGVDMDYDNATAHLKVAADAGNKEAQYIIGRCYYHGISVNHDYTKAVKYYKLAAAQGHPKADYYLAQCYLYGLGVTQDDNQAIECLKRSAAKGGFQARANLAQYYQIGFHTEPNLELSKKYWKMALQDDSFNLSDLPGIDDDFQYSSLKKEMEDGYDKIVNGE